MHSCTHSLLRHIYVEQFLSANTLPQSHGYLSWSWGPSLTSSNHPGLTVLFLAHVQQLTQSSGYDWTLLLLFWFLTGIAQIYAVLGLWKVRHWGVTPCPYAGLAAKDFEPPLLFPMLLQHTLSWTNPFPIGFVLIYVLPSSKCRCSGFALFQQNPSLLCRCQDVSDSSVSQTGGSQNEVPGWVASTTPGNLLEAEVLGPCPETGDSGTCQVESHRLRLLYFQNIKQTQMPMDSHTFELLDKGIYLH